ncbi:MAG: DUF2399 domain-containing protein [Streptomycetaceae bacterium]|nr:DUF2399 domain-containing protein [Streptomycetaceae bacterium]
MNTPAERPAGPPCALCTGGCADADLTPLLTATLTWLWSQLAQTADRRGDRELLTGTIRIRLPEDAADRAAATGLLGGTPLRAGGTRQLDLALLTTRIRVRGQHLTPGGVAAHAVARPLAAAAHRKARRVAAEDRLRAARATAIAQLSPDTPQDPDGTWERLRRAGWIARLMAADEPEELVARAIRVIIALPEPGQRVDRRLLAQRAAGTPHALDRGALLASLVLAELAAADRIPPGLHPRIAWDAVGVDWDDLVGGILTVGVLPARWTVPGGTALTIPPRELAHCAWQPPPHRDAWAFVTENLSIARAACEEAAANPRIRVLCTSGTPSELECRALARLTEHGWRLAVRADFDTAGLAHVAQILAHAPDATPWRMRASDYQQAADRTASGPEPLLQDHLMTSPWDPVLADTMRSRGLSAWEECLLPELLDDLRVGAPR